MGLLELQHRIKKPSLMCISIDCFSRKTLPARVCCAKVNKQWWRAQLIKLRGVYWLLGSVLASFGCSAQLAAAGRAELKPLLVNAVDWPPFFIRKHRDGLPGLAREILDHCLPAAGYVPRYEWLPIKRTYQYMQQGKLDLAVYSHKADREPYLHYSRLTMFSSQLGFAVRQDFKPAGRELQDVEPFRLGYLAGLALSPEVNLMLDRKKAAGRGAVELFQLQDLFSKLLQQPAPVDVVINAKETLQWVIYDEQLQQQAKVLPLALGRKDYYLTLSRRSTAVADPDAFFQAFDGCLATLQQQPAYQTMLRRYHVGEGQ